MAARLASWGRKRWLRFSNDTLVLGVREKPGVGDIRPMLDELDQIVEAASSS